MLHPQFVQTPGEATEQFSVSPYKLDPDNLPDTPLLLFDFPKDFVISFGDYDLAGSLFDYFNPLLLTQEICKRIKFYNKSAVNCLSLITTKNLSHLLSNPIFYPPHSSINYLRGVSTRSMLGRQVYDMFGPNDHLVARLLDPEDVVDIIDEDDPDLAQSDEMDEIFVQLNDNPD